jgi:ABC-type branched-subunit amino acid transport system ATPase component
LLSEIEFCVLARKDPLPRIQLPLFLLTTDNWDDFNHQIQFHLSHLATGGLKTEIGTLKVLQRTSPQDRPMVVATTTKLPASFRKLEGNFVSLGQSDDFYKNLHKLMGDRASEVLDALRDIAWHPAFASDFEPTVAFRNAMMRENGAQRARRFGRAWASGRKIIEQPAFDYVGAIEGADFDVEGHFAFNASDPVPGRIVGIIGRNAAGKTRYLASLGSDLAQIARSSEKTIQTREKRFPSGRPLFTRVIAISYSAFDRFKRPPRDSSSSYVYCGIRNDKGGLSQSALRDNYRHNQERIRERGEQSTWTRHMRTILGDLSEQLTTSLEQEINNAANSDETLSLLSSGQSILAHFVTALMAWIQPNSLVLFDEPETHLHPNAVASLFLVLSQVLEEFDSYAVIATHSPVVIQEIPAKRVLVFQREGNVTTAEPLRVESFGQSVTELTRQVFETSEVESLYRRTLRDLAEKETVEDVLARFSLGLSLSAEAYLLARYGKKVRGGI